ncbi:MAG: tyrosinase family protein [Proteobacteria bacterium]|nr:tyrosinase family protein [Pseudomonadota bacterium]
MATTLAVLAVGSARAAPIPGPIRQSLSSFSTDPAKVAALRRGVAAMKALPPSDHRSWFFQAATHAYSEKVFTTELARDPKLAGVDRKKFWNQCPHFGQCSADFAIWHRAYLHFFERTLREAAGDSNLALPYWDYENPAGRFFPAIFVPEFLDAAKADANPLYHPNRELSFVRGLLEISAAIGEAPKTRGAETFFHQPGQPGFGGDVLDSDHTQIGLLEQRPHNDIHIAVGGVIGTENGAMADITTAAFDPVFWVHHANVDRMWAEWASHPGKSWGPAPSPAWFDERPWSFVDADGSEVSVSRREAIALAASYDAGYTSQISPPLPPPPPPPPPVDSDAGGGPLRAIAPPMVGAAPPPRPRPRAEEHELLIDRKPLVVSPRRTGRREVGAVSWPAVNLNAPELADSNARVYLELSDISLKLVPSSGFAVYLDIIGEAVSDDPVGLIDIFGATHHGMSPGMPMMKPAQRFDVTGILRRSRGPFTLRVEPYDLLVSPTGRPNRRRSDAITIGSVRFVVLN